MLSMRLIFQSQSSATDQFCVQFYNHWNNNIGFYVSITAFTMIVHIKAWRERQLELFMCDLYMTDAGLKY